MKWGTWLRAEWDRVAGFGLIGLGALFVLLGYLGVRNTPFVAEQMAYMASGGIGGLFCLGFGVGLLLSADLHDEWRKLDRLEAELRGEVVVEPDPEPGSGVPEPDTGSASGSAPANGRHRPDLVPQPAGTAGALAVALSHPTDTHPAAGTRRALAFVTLALLLPLAVAGAGWRRASQTADMDVAARGLGLAVAAVVIGLVVIAGWGLWMRISVLRRRAAVARAVRWSARTRFAVTAAAAQSAPVVEGAAVYVAAGHRRYHRAGCPMLEWVEAVAVSPDGLSPDVSACGLCQTS